MTECSDGWALPQIWYTKDKNHFEENTAFLSEFANPADYKKIRLMIAQYEDSNCRDRCSAQLFQGEQREYITIIYSDDENSVLSAYFLNTDIIGSALFETKISKQNEQEFYNILESMHDDFVIIDKDGIIINALPNFEELYGLPAAEAIGKSVYEMEQRKIFNPSIAIRVMKSLEKETLLQLTGAGKYLNCTAIPVFDSNGQLQKIISYTRDVTEYEILKEEAQQLQESLEYYNTQLGQLRNERKKYSKIIGKSPAISNISMMIEKIAKFDANVLLTGESGVGKSLFAEVIHGISRRKDGPFITINCGAIPENLLESELFGYEKGAFTGAGQTGKPGLIELSDGGVLFLDEIGDLPLHMQVKLLKVIQDRKVMRVGGTVEKEIDFRLIAATNKDLRDLIEEKQFREDLYYRLSVLSIQIPPLRERKEDIFPLVTHFVNKYNEKYNVSHVFSSKAIDCMEAYTWPGNTRELENLVERMVIIADEEYVISEAMLPQNICNQALTEIYSIKGKTLKEIMETMERKVILTCYEEHKTTVEIAKALGISQPSASLKLSKYLKGGKKR